MDLIIQFVGGLILFLNKVLLWKKNRIGWILGIIGISIFSWPTYQKELWIILVYNGGLAVLMMYGFALTTNLKNLISEFAQLLLRFILSFMTIGLCFYLFFKVENSPNFNGYQLAQSITGLTGSLLLAFNTKKTNIAGWISNIVSHFISTYVMYSKDLDIMAFFQIISIIIAFKGIKSELNQKSSSY